MTGHGFLRPAAPSEDVDRLFADDVEEVGYVMNLSRGWAHVPAAQQGLFELMTTVVRAGSLSFRQRAVLVTATAGAFGDSYCALAWGSRLAGVSDDRVAAAVVRGDDEGLDDAERALARWARRVARDPNGTEQADVQELRDAGFDDPQIFAVTVFVALRLAFSTVNDALGSLPDRELRESAPSALLEAVSFGRPVAEARD